MIGRRGRWIRTWPATKVFSPEPRLASGIRRRCRSVLSPAAVAAAAAAAPASCGVGAGTAMSMAAGGGPAAAAAGMGPTGSGGVGWSAATIQGRPARSDVRGRRGWLRWGLARGPLRGRRGVRHADRSTELREELAAGEAIYGVSGAARAHVWGQAGLIVIFVPPVLGR